MSSPTDTEVRDGRGARGSVTAFVVCLSSLVVGTAGLVADGGRYVAAHGRASDVALAAARFGTQNMVDIRAGDPRVDCVAARSQAGFFAARRGHSATVSCDPFGVTVTIRGAVPMRFLSMFGVGDRGFTVVRRAEAIWG